MSLKYLGGLGLGLIALLSGCISVPPSAPHINKGRPVSVPTVAVQYRSVIEGNFGCNTAEIYWQNTNAVPIAFNSIALDKEFLPLTSDKIYWWQFYPSPVVKPGGTMLCQINFRERSRKNQEVTLIDSNGPVDHVSLPPYSSANMDKQITAVTYSLDYKRMFVQFEAGRWLPMRVWINRQEINDFKLMKPVKNDTPGMVAFDAPLKIETGTPLYICIRFNDGTWKHAYVRALNGVFLDSYNMTNEVIRRSFALDQTIPVIDPQSPSAGDVCCYDAINRLRGQASRQLVEERKQLWKEGTISNRLTTLHYCTAKFSLQWDLYGQLMDMALASPYSYGHGYDRNKYLELEAKYMNLSARSEAPRPFGWIVEAHKHADRYLTPQEIELIDWMVINRGAKGIRYFTYDKKEGFINDQILIKALPPINNMIARYRWMISPLAYVGSHNVGGDKGVEISESWAGDKGICVYVRNLNYSIATNSMHENHFSITPKLDLKVDVIMPEWINTGTPLNLKTGKLMAASRLKPGILTVRIDELDAFCVIWIPNRINRRTWF